LLWVIQVECKPASYVAIYSLYRNEGLRAGPLQLKLTVSAWPGRLSPSASTPGQYCGILLNEVLR